MADCLSTLADLEAVLWPNVAIARPGLGAKPPSLEHTRQTLFNQDAPQDAGSMQLYAPEMEQVDGLCKSGDFHRALQMCERLRQVVVGAKDPEGEKAFLAHLGYCNSQLNQYTSAPRLTKCIECFEALELKVAGGKSQSIVWANLVESERVLHDYNKETECLEIALKHSIEFGNRRVEAMTCAVAV